MSVVCFTVSEQYDDSDFENKGNFYVTFLSYVKEMNGHISIWRFN